MIHGITEANLGQPDYEKALEQHSQYVRALESCGLEVLVLEALEAHPDATFVEDTALLTRNGAILTRPGAESRRGEVDSIGHAVTRFYNRIQSIQAPGTLDAGDIMMVGDHFYVGLSARTNQEGADQLNRILKEYGMTSSCVTLKEVLHLKTGLAYLEKGVLAISGEFLKDATFDKFKKVIVDPDESYSANCIWVNGTVIVPAGFPKTRQSIESLGYETLEVNVSEFRKLDGGLSCLSLRF